MKKVTFLILVQLSFILCSCTLPEEKDLQESKKWLALANNEQAFDPAKGSPGLGIIFTKDIMEAGLDMAELKTHLTNEEIENIAEIMLNKQGTSRKEMEKAIKLFNRMKKEDYEKTYILYLEKQVPRHEPQIKFFKIIYRKAKKHDESFIRLPKATQSKLMLDALEEFKKIHNQSPNK